MNARTHFEQWSITNATANADKSQPVWQAIRSRLLAANHRFHANDNIAEFILPGELDLLQEEVRENLEAVLNSLVIDTDNDHNTRETAKRVAKMYLTEVFKGRYSAAPAVTQFPNVEQLSELLIVGPIMIRSACSHHLCPIVGRVWIGVMPNENSHLIGLSKYARLAEWILSRPQIQEEAVSQLANALEAHVRPDGIAVVLEAEHFCMSWRGVKDNGVKMLNSVMRGSFITNPGLRAEFLSLLPRT